MLIVTQVWYPASKAPEIGKLYLEVMKKFPNDKTISKTMVQGAVRTIKEGIHNIVIYAIKPGKVKEAMDLAQNRLLMLGAIDGFKYETYIAYEISEAMPLIGLQAPSE